MATGHEVVTVTTTAASLVQGRVDRHNSNSVDRSLLLQNRSVQTIYLGGEDVTTTDFGYALPANGEIALDLNTHDDLFAVAAAECDLNILYLGL